MPGIRPSDELLRRVRHVCLALPSVEERTSHGTPTFFVARRAFVQAWVAGHHDHSWPHLWCAAPPGAQETLVEADPLRYFRPPYVGGRGWIGIRLDRRPRWPEVAALCEEAYRAVAPARLAAQL